MQNLELENLIENQPKKKNSVVDFIFDTSYFVRSNKYGSIIEKYSEEIIFNNKRANNYYYFVIGFLIFVIGFRAMEDKFSLYIVIGLLLLLMFLFFYNKSRELKEIKISEEGLEINKVQYFWNEIYDYGFMIEPKSKNYNYYLVIFTITGDKVSYTLYDFYNPEEIIETMNFFRNRYNSNQNLS